MTEPQANPRPVLDLPRSPLEFLLEGVALVGIFVSIGLVIQSWSLLPATIPVHFGWSGRPDAWGHKILIGLLPVLGFVFNSVFFVLAGYPHTFNYPVTITAENARIQYRLARGLLAWMKVEIIGLFTLLLWQQIQVAIGKTEQINMAGVLIAFVILLGTIGFYLWRAFTVASIEAQ